MLWNKEEESKISSHVHSATATMYKVSHRMCVCVFLCISHKVVVKFNHKIVLFLSIFTSLHPIGAEKYWFVAKFRAHRSGPNIQNSYRIRIKYETRNFLSSFLSCVAVIHSGVNKAEVCSNCFQVIRCHRWKPDLKTQRQSRVALFSIEFNKNLICQHFNNYVSNLCMCFPYIGPLPSLYFWLCSKNTTTWLIDFPLTDANCHDDK